jgi:hypothetical protein
MKKTHKFLTIFLVLSFLSLAVFGFLGLAFSSGFSQCAASVVPGALSCPMGSGSEPVEIFHSFSGVILTSIVLLLGVLFYAVSSEQFLVLTVRAFIAKRQPEILNNEGSFNKRILNWLSLRVRSDLLA